MDRISRDKLVKPSSIMLAGMADLISHRQGRPDGELERSDTRQDS